MSWLPFSIYMERPVPYVAPKILETTDTTTQANPDHLEEINKLLSKLEDVDLVVREILSLHKEVVELQQRVKTLEES
jgi:hypothetical protein